MGSSNLFAAIIEADACEIDSTAISSASWRNVLLRKVGHTFTHSKHSVLSGIANDHS